MESQLLTDRSRCGISFAPTQEGLDGQKQLINCSSFELNSTESCYAPMELECLGVIYTIQECSFYIMGVLGVLASPSVTLPVPACNGCA